MSDTGERILLTSLGLFARKGYGATSVSDIAGALGITKGALYRPFASKRAIFDAILARMNRPYAIAAVDRFCEAAVRRLGPRLAFGADVITGFPGETDADFAATRAFLLRHPFVNLHVFPYSERPGTPAATMDGTVPLAVRRARAKELEAVGRTKRLAFATFFLGKDVEVCVERDRTGWTAEYLKCALTGIKGSTDRGNRLARRSLVRGRVVRVEGETLVADPARLDAP